ncbi:MAG: OmpA family protein [Pseudomonadota bacterium]
MGESVRLPFIPYGLAPALALGVLLIFGLFGFSRGVVQHTTERTAQQALADVGADWATPWASGQWVTLEGRPPSRAAGLAAINAVRNAEAPTLFGPHRPATRVTDRFIWPDNATDAAEDGALEEANANDAATASPADWRFRLSQGVLRITGDIPDAATRDAIVYAATEMIDPPRISRVDNGLKLNNAPLEAGYLDVAMRGLDVLKRCDRGLISFEDQSLNVNCELPAAEEDAVRTLASAPLTLGRLGDLEILANEAVANCEQSMSDLLTMSSIEFPTSSAVIDVDSGALLNDIARAARACPGSLRIEGHTDNTGRDALNTLLSRRRADAVRQALVERGLQSGRLIVRGYGSTRPIADNETEEGRARNRRIEIRVARAQDDQE